MPDDLDAVPRDRQRDAPVADAVLEHAAALRRRRARSMRRRRCARRTSRCSSRIFVVRARARLELAVALASAAFDAIARLGRSVQAGCAPCASIHSSTASWLGRSKWTLPAAISRSAVTAALFFE